jgi:spermidine synthase
LTRPWQILASSETPEGRLELRRRGAAEWVITIGGRVLMNGAAHRSEAALAELACRPIARRPRPRVLLGGLGMGYTLRTALDGLPRQASVTVAEIDPVIVEWCRGPLAELTGRAVDDPRVSIEVEDIATVIARAAAAAPAVAGMAGAAAATSALGMAGAAARDVPPAGRGGGYDAILLDLYEGPRTPVQGRDDPLYGRAALSRARAALTPGGMLAVWSEDLDTAFETRLTAAGFGWERRRPGRGGPRHTVYLARNDAPAERPRRISARARSRG